MIGRSDGRTVRRSNPVRESTGVALPNVGENGDDRRPVRPSDHSPDRTLMTDALKRTPFYDFHVAAKAKMVPFAGFEMPVQYPAGITREHEIVRTAVGVFDVSHMGEFEVTGKDRNAFVNSITSNEVSALKEGQAQ